MTPSRARSPKRPYAIPEKSRAAMIAASTPTGRGPIRELSSGRRIPYPGR